MSFERFRKEGPAGLETITAGFVGTLHCKSVTFRVLRDEDFQRLVGLASEVHRLKGGITLVAKAAKVLMKHHDKESVEMVIASASMLSESTLLPECQGHEAFEITDEEAAEYAEAEPVDAASVPRPTL